MPLCCNVWVEPKHPLESKGMAWHTMRGEGR